MMVAIPPAVEARGMPNNSPLPKLLFLSSDLTNGIMAAKTIEVVAVLDSTIEIIMVALITPMMMFLGFVPAILSVNLKSRELEARSQGSL